ncbi:DNA internalization-related competence protein ComEC/Rec2, partial [Rhizobium sp. KAs_5_22]
DKDHRGGLKSIEKEMQVDQLIVNEPKEYPHGLNCHLYPKWHWDGIEFRFFPIKTHFNNKNNNSCILRVSTMAGSILLPGDIERKAEDY